VADKGQQATDGELLLECAGEKKARLVSRARLFLLEVVI
jgi:hypothetical protein